MPRERSFCTGTVLQDRVNVIADSRLDPRFEGGVPTLMGDAVGFDAGEPIHSMDGHRIEALCNTDPAPRQIAAAQLAELHVLAGRVERELRAQTLLGRH